MHKILSLILVMGVSLFNPLNTHTFAQEKPPKATSVLNQLEKDSHGTMNVKWNPNVNTPSLITGKLSLPSKHSPEWIARGFLNKLRTLYGLQNLSRDLKAVKVEKKTNVIRVHFQHLLFQIPVWKDQLIVEMSSDGVIRKVEGTIHPNLERQLFHRPMHAAISEKQAIRRAKGLIPRELAKEPEVESYYLPTRPGTPLVYAVKLQYVTPDKTTLTLIHSLTGRIIEIQVL
ncbi:hypothetical protein [Paenibacillus wynnii]|uniref:hypothetical protein n=1 Tax=Paenibacillus wynnii TaxID=268407 RepID=UPI0027949657|nr:hypothetical protein [Paenibacillus wynnii]MDQ0193239.1 Zn-dependent metalloprotease [Paenibacillus wynnii]